MYRSIKNWLKIIKSWVNFTISINFLSFLESQQIEKYWCHYQNWSSETSFSEKIDFAIKIPSFFNFFCIQIEKSFVVSGWYLFHCLFAENFGVFAFWELARSTRVIDHSKSSADPFYQIVFKYFLVSDITLNLNLFTT
jgi:hypothetical protein